MIASEYLFENLFYEFDASTINFYAVPYNKIASCKFYITCITDCITDYTPEKSIQVKKD